MKPVVWMAAGTAAAWLLVTLGLGDRANPEAFWGMAGPLVSACVSWIAYVRVHARSPVRLTNVMVAGIALKLLFFTVYVAVMVRVLGLRPEPFVASLVGAFIVLHAIEAFSLRRMLMEGLRALDGERA